MNLIFKQGTSMETFFKSQLLILIFGFININAFTPTEFKHLTRICGATALAGGLVGGSTVLPSKWWRDFSKEFQEQKYGSKVIRHALIGGVVGTSIPLLYLRRRLPSSILKGAPELHQTPMKIYGALGAAAGFTLAHTTIKPSDVLIMSDNSKKKYSSVVPRSTLLSGAAGAYIGYLARSSDRRVALVITPLVLAASGGISATLSSIAERDIPR